MNRRYLGMPKICQNLLYYNKEWDHGRAYSHMRGVSYIYVNGKIYNSQCFYYNVHVTNDV